MASVPANKCYLNGVKLSDMPVKPIQDYWLAAGERSPFPNKTRLVELTVARIVELCPTPNGAGEYHVDGLKQVEPNAAAAGGVGGSEIAVLQAQLNAMADLIVRQSEALQTIHVQQAAQSSGSALSGPTGGVLPAEWPTPRPPLFLPPPTPGPATGLQFQPGAGMRLGAS